MTSTATAPHLSHPWFSSKSTKRKVSEDYAPSKRPKFSALAQEFAHLNLTHNLPQQHLLPPCAQAPFTPQASIDRQDWTDTQIRPPSPPIFDIKMKTQSWYEPVPDRIVVTSLDSSDDEDSEDSTGQHTQDPSVYISPLLLDRIKAIPSNPLPVPPTQALVLYRPLPHRVSEALDGPKPSLTDDNAMDIEP